MILLSTGSSTDEFQERLELCLETSPETPLVIISNDQAPELLLEAMQKGARDLVAEGG